MESALRHIGNFISTGGGEDGHEMATVYLNSMDEHLNACTSQRDIIQLVDTINFLLSKAKTRIIGLQVLDKIWPWLNQEILEQKTELWSSFILKACNRDELQKYGGFIYRTLANLARTLKQYSELSKSFGSNHLNKILEVITQSTSIDSIPALRCLEVYLSIYTKTNGQIRASIERFLMGFLDKYEDSLNYHAGRCLHYLQYTSVPGSKDMKTKEQWKSYQLQLIQNMTDILNDAYGHESLRNSTENGSNLNIPPLKLSTDPNERAAQLFVRFRNLSSYLRTALSEPSPVAKAFMPKRVLNLITHGLIVTCNASNQGATYSKIAFGVFLPKIQLDLLELSKTLIRTLHGNLRIYYRSLLNSLVHVLKTSATTNTAIRAKVYEVITLWCETLQEGSRCELYADEIIPEILKDISPLKNELVTQTAKTKEKHKKGSNILLNIKDCKLNTFEKCNQTFYLVGIKCLQILMKSCSTFLKPTLIASVHKVAIKISSSFSLTNKKNPYNNWKNRLEMYRLLLTLLTRPHQHCPPPSQIILQILRTAQSTESNTEIRLICKEVIGVIETIVHPQKESLIIPIEARSIRNAFLKLGQERHLEELHDSISTLRYEHNINKSKDETIDIQEHTPQTELEQNGVLNNDNYDVSHSFSEERQDTDENNSNEIAQQKPVEESDDDEINFNGPIAKKKKIDENINISPKKISERIEISEDSDEDTENLRPKSPISKSDGEIRPIEAPVLEKPDITITTCRSNEALQTRSSTSKNDEIEIAEMEAFFVDELKKTL